MSTPKITPRRRRELPPAALVAEASNIESQEHIVGVKADGIDYQRMIAEAAYYRAEHRGFAPGHEVEDWLAAEAEIVGENLERVPSPRSAK